MENKMDNRLEELIFGALASMVYTLAHLFNIQLIDANVLNTGFDLGNKLINMLIGIATACIGYLAVWLIKKYITKEIK